MEQTPPNSDDNERILNYYREVQLEVSKSAYLSTCHYLILKDGKPCPHGSGVFVKIENERFLFTAAHVTDNMENDIYVGIGPHDLLKLGGELTCNIAPGLRNDDKIDISILKLNRETIEKIGTKYTFLNQDELGINHKLIQLPMYQSVGFPATKSKYNSYKDEIKSVPFLYTTMPAEEAIYKELNCELFSNVVVHYDKNKVRDYSSGTLTTGPDPFGISGSGLWFTPSQVKSDKLDKKLVAIMTEWPIENKKYWIGTRIDIFTETIRQKYNLNIERSTLVKVNL